MFYALALCLGAIAVAFVLWPLVAKHRKRIEHGQFMRDLYRDRVHELETEARDDETRRAMEDELGAVLLAEVDETAMAEERVGSARLVGGIAVAAVVLGYAVYWIAADIGQLDVAGAEDVMMLSPQTHAPAIQSWSEKLAQRVAEAPGDAKSWYLLGHARLKLREYQPAAEAFATTHRLVADDLTVQVYWLQARYLAAQGQLDEVSKNLANDILATDPSNSGVLEILALDAFQRGDSAGAIRQLNRALQGTRDMGRQAALALALRQARAQLDPAPAGIDVEVSASHPVPQGSTIFVIARPPGGGMPYAVVKRPALMVPFTVTVDDLVSMSEGRSLSMAEEFEIVVRVSESGLAMAEEGDWQWLSEPLGPAALGASHSLAADLGPPARLAPSQ
jgi:cytochrome c-type biogenesis protein CcmH